MPLAELRAVKEKLSHLGDDLWAKTTLYVLNRTVIFDKPDGEGREEIVSGQGIVNIPLQVVTRQLKAEVEQLRKRRSDTIGLIQTERGIAQNRPTIAGTRVPVDAVLSFLKAGYSVDDIISEYPSLTRKDIMAVKDFAKVA